MLIIDGHLDLAMNALHWNRDLTRPLDEIRGRERDWTDKVDRGRGVVSFPEMRRAGIGICIATQIGHSVSQKSPLQGWHSPEIAWAQTQGQLAWYRAMEEAGELVAITDRETMDRLVRLWSSDSPRGGADSRDDTAERRPIGYLLSLEGADSILTLDHLHRAYDYGLRALGPAHYGPGRYSPGTGVEGGLEPAGRELLAEMRRLGIALDVTHLTDEAFWEALELFDGPVWASHNNCRALVPGQRQFSDEQLRALIQRDAVVGSALDAWMIHPGWIRGTTTPEETGLKIERIADHMDHICQLAGNARHCAIGSDLDGGYGREQCPSDLDSIADTSSLLRILGDRGYSDPDIEGIMHGNWLRSFEKIWSRG